MDVDLTIENVPDDLVARLRERAARTGRSLEDEVLAIFEAAAMSRSTITVEELSKRAEARGVKTGDSVRMIREDRDSR